MSESITYPTWRTIRRGKYKSFVAYVMAVSEKGCVISQNALRELRDITWASDEADVELVIASGKDLGLRDGYSPAEGEAAAAAHGLDSCDPEDAAAAYEQCDGLVEDETYWITMRHSGEPLDDYVSSYYVCWYPQGEPRTNEAWTEFAWTYEDTLDCGMDANHIRVWRRRPPITTPTPPA